MSNVKISNTQEVLPTEEELHILNEYHSGNPDYQKFISHENLLKELDL